MPTALGSRAVAVLATLVQRPNEYVTKDASWTPRGRASSSRKAISRCKSRRSAACSRKRPAASVGSRHCQGAVIASSGRLPNFRTRARTPGGRKRSNLSEPLTSFIGRERELVEIKRLLPGKRLLTLVGVGGIGKTRLALQAAAEVMAAYRDGVWLVELGRSSNPVLVPMSVAQVLGVQEASGHAARRYAVRASRGAAVVVDPGQLRAPARCVRGAGRIGAPQRRGHDDHRDQSRAAARRRRADLPAAGAIAARALGERRRRWGAPRRCNSSSSGPGGSCPPSH